MAYTYLIGWKKLNQYYYGVRYAKNARPNDLWVTYFTSSKHVKLFVQINGQPDTIQIRKVFESSDAAREWEVRVLTKLNVPYNKKFLNRTNNKSIFYERTPEHRASISGENNPMYGKPSHFRGKTHALECRKRISDKRRGQKTGRTSEDFTQEWKDNISKNHARLSRVQSKEEIEWRRETCKNSAFSKIAVGTVWMNDGVKSYRIQKEEIHLHPDKTLGRLSRVSNGQ